MNLIRIEDQHGDVHYVDPHRIAHLHQASNKNTTMICVVGSSQQIVVNMPPDQFVSEELGQITDG